MRTRPVRIHHAAAPRRHSRQVGVVGGALPVLALTVAAAVIAAGCSLGGAKPAGEAAAPTDPAAVLRQDVDRLRAELGELRSLVDTVRRSSTEHADQTAGETRAELEAVQKALEATSRHDLQRQIEVLDAQARRIDILDKRAAEQGQALRRLEMAVTGIESQLTRVLENAAATPARGARPGSSPGPPAAAPAPASGDAPASGASASEASSATSAAGADLAPPAMLGRPSSSTTAAPTAKPAAAPRETKAAPAPRPSPEEPPRAAKAASPAGEAKAPAAEAPPRPARAAASAAPAAAAAAAAPGPLTARQIFDRAMESWKKSEMGQAVLDFEELVQTFPADPLVAPAQFRIGEAYYAARDFERAAIAYRKAVDLAPQGKDTPQALLRLGLAYRAQKRESDARRAWNQLVRDFPESEATEEARRALRTR